MSAQVVNWFDTQRRKRSRLGLPFKAALPSSHTPRAAADPAHIAQPQALSTLAEQISTHHTPLAPVYSPHENPPDLQKRAVADASGSHVKEETRQEEQKQLACPPGSGAQSLGTTKEQPQPIALSDSEDEGRQHDSGRPVTSAKEQKPAKDLHATGPPPSANGCQYVSPQTNATPVRVEAEKEVPPQQAERAVEESHRLILTPTGQPPLLEQPEGKPVPAEESTFLFLGIRFPSQKCSLPEWSAKWMVYQVEILEEFSSALVAHVQSLAPLQALPGKPLEALSKSEASTLTLSVERSVHGKALSILPA